MKMLLCLVIALRIIFAGPIGMSSPSAPPGGPPQVSVAQEIWDNLKSYGYSDIVCAGILGNIMVEAAGKDFDIQPFVETKNYYGICQWSKKNYPEVWGVTLEEQCLFIESTIESEINTFGGLYAEGFGYNDFLKLTSAREAALAFAKCYERCGSGGYESRQNCAVTAYETFNNQLAGPRMDVPPSQKLFYYFLR